MHHVPRRTRCTTRACELPARRLWWTKCLARLHEDNIVHDAPWYIYRRPPCNVRSFLPFFCKNHTCQHHYIYAQMHPSNCPTTKSPLKLHLRHATIVIGHLFQTIQGTPDKYLWVHRGTRACCMAHVQGSHMMQYLHF